MRLYAGFVLKGTGRIKVHASAAVISDKAG